MDILAQYSVPFPSPSSHFALMPSFSSLRPTFGPEADSFVLNCRNCQADHTKEPALPLTACPAGLCGGVGAARDWREVCWAHLASCSAAAGLWRTRAA